MVSYDDMTTVYITGASNKPSGGVKVMNQVAVLFKEKGFESFVVTADDSPQADFLDNPASCLSVEEYEKRLKEDDVSIDFWPDRRLVEITNKKKNRLRIFWQHGASIPIGGTTVGDLVFRKGNPYIQHWNVSRTCADYFQHKYGLKMSIIHPFFDSPTMMEFQAMSPVPRDGFLLLARRGQKYIPTIQQLLKRHRLTIFKEPYHERDFFEALRQHLFFVSIDDGIHAPSLTRRGKNFIRALLYSQERERMGKINRWIVPSDHLLGFPMPPVEAAWLGCITIGFAMGGGLEWMKPENYFLAEYTDTASLLEQIKKALRTKPVKLESICERAKQDTAIFTKDHTWQQIISCLHL